MDTATTVEKASPVVAVSFHWNYHGIPEMRSAFDWYSKAVVELAKEVTVIGHGHPKRKDLPDWYRAHGIEYVADFFEVCRRADVYACDNSSTLFEFASTGRPVVVLNAPWYFDGIDVRAHHGLRFWDASQVGRNVRDPGRLAWAVDDAMRFDWPFQEDCLDIVYAYRTGAAQRAADAIAAWVQSEVAA